MNSVEGRVRMPFWAYWLAGFVMNIPASLLGSGLILNSRWTVWGWLIISCMATTVWVIPLWGWHRWRGGYAG